MSLDKAFQSWLTYSLAVFIIWALILIFMPRIKNKNMPTRQTFLLIFAGYLIAWVALTIKFLIILKKIV